MEQNTRILTKPATDSSVAILLPAKKCRQFFSVVNPPSTYEESDHTNGDLIQISFPDNSFEYVNSIPDNTLE